MQTTDWALAPGGWPEGVATPSAAFSWHLDELARWLRGAGAEGRFFVVYLSGDRARTEFVDGLRLRRVDVVPAPGRLGQPVHSALASHQGDHFNDKLYVVDGLECEDPERLLREIGLNIATLRRTATWACVLVESPRALLAMESAGGIVRRHASRRVCLLSDEDPRPTESLDAAAAVTRWRREHRAPELAYWTAMAPDFEPTLTDFDRFVRCGWAGLEPKGSAHVVTRALRGLLTREIGQAALPLPLRDAPAVAAAMHAYRGSDAAAREARQRAVEAAPTDANGLAARAFASAEAAADAGDLESLEALLTEADGLLTASALEADPELHFEVIEKRIVVDQFMARPGQARLGLERLDELAVRLASPLWRGRALLARARLSGDLDSRKAREHGLAAAALFEMFQWPAWAMECEAWR